MTIATAAFGDPAAVLFLIGLAFAWFTSPVAAAIREALV